MNRITETYHVSPQIAAEDAPALAEAGFKLVICNRPDAENPPAMRANAIRRAVKAAGMEFAELPLTHQTMTPDNVQAQADLIANAAGPVLAYCASGTRCSVIWALGAAGEIGAEAALNATQAAGYDLSGMRPLLESLSKI